MPHEGTNNIAFALISLKPRGCESYRARAPIARAWPFNFARNKFILARKGIFGKVTL